MKTFKFKITLLENGINSIVKGVEFLNNYEKENNNIFDLKFGITLFHNCIELLLKQILINNFGEEEIFVKKDKKLKEKLALAKDKNISVFDLENPVKTINFSTLLERIESKVGLSKDLKLLLIDLQSIRNSLEHYGINKELEKIENLLIKLKNPIINWFISNNIQIPNSIIESWNILQQNILKHIYSLRGSNFIKDIIFENQSLELTYIANYNEYLKFNPNTNLTEEDFKIYWNKGNARIKALNDGGVRLLCKIPEIDNVKISLIDSEKEYLIRINRKEIKEFLSSNFEQINQNWDDIFSDKYVYNKSLSLDFFNKFGIIKNVV